MLKLNYLDAPRLLHRMGIRFYSTRVIRLANNQIEGMRIDLAEPLTMNQLDFLHAIDTFHEFTPYTIMFQSFAQYKRESQSPGLNWIKKHAK